MLLLTKIKDPSWANRVGPFKTGGPKPTGPYWAEMWAISGENVGRIWDPYGEPYGTHMKQVEKTRMGPTCFAHMGPI